MTFLPEHCFTLEKLKLKSKIYCYYFRSYLYFSSASVYTSASLDIENRSKSLHLKFNCRKYLEEGESFFSPVKFIKVFKCTEFCFINERLSFPDKTIGESRDVSRMEFLKEPFWYCCSHFRPQCYTCEFLPEIRFPCEIYIQFLATDVGFCSKKMNSVVFNILQLAIIFGISLQHLVNYGRGFNYRSKTGLSIYWFMIEAQIKYMNRNCIFCGLWPEIPT